MRDLGSTTSYDYVSIGYNFSSVRPLIVAERTNIFMKYNSLLPKKWAQLALNNAFSNSTSPSKTFKRAFGLL